MKAQKIVVEQLVGGGYFVKSLTNLTEPHIATIIDESEVHQLIFDTDITVEVRGK